jgi:hypothetical protein
LVGAAFGLKSGADFLSLTADNVEPPQLLAPAAKPVPNQTPDDRNALLAKLTVTVFEE